LYHKTKGLKTGTGSQIPWEAVVLRQNCTSPLF
jgi:hypothetical protein